MKYEYLVTNSWNNWWTEYFTSKQKALETARHLAKQGYIHHSVHLFRRPVGPPECEWEKVWTTQIK